jgi:hypothetical protein
MKIQGKPTDFAKNAHQEFNEKRYHSPQDEVQADWHFAGLAVLGGFAFDIAREVAGASTLPTWNEGDEFHPSRLKGRRK